MSSCRRWVKSLVIRSHNPWPITTDAPEESLNPWGLPGSVLTSSFMDTNESKPMKATCLADAGDGSPFVDMYTPGRRDESSHRSPISCRVTPDHIVRAPGLRAMETSAHQGCPEGQG